jgi:hypothetical protein
MGLGLAMDIHGDLSSDEPDQAGAEPVLNEPYQPLFIPGIKVRGELHRAVRD